DVSFIAPPGYGGRPTPNPNVLIELGYAAHRHGWNGILCVFNAATGRVEDLPLHPPALDHCLLTPPRGGQGGSPQGAGRPTPGQNPAHPDDAGRCGGPGTG